MPTPWSAAETAALQSLLTRVARAIEGALREAMAAHDLTPAQAEVLRFAGTIRPDVATVGQLARVLGVRHPTALGILRPLVVRGLVERRAHPFDARQHTLGLTETGRALLEELEHSEPAIARALSGLEEDAREALGRGLIGLVRAFAESKLVVVPAPCRGCIFFDEDRDKGAEAPHYCRAIRRYLTDSDSRMPCPEHHPPREAPGDAA